MPQMAHRCLTLQMQTEATCLTAGRRRTHQGASGRVLCHTGLPLRGHDMWIWIFLGILLGLIVLIGVVLQRRGSGGGRSGGAEYSAETAAGQAGRQMDRGGMGGGAGV